MKDSTVVQNADFKNMFDKYNKYYKIFDDYIVNKNLFVLKYDDETMAYEDHGFIIIFQYKYDDETMAYEDHVWGMLPFHYYKDYYTKRLNELVEIKNLLGK